MKVAVIHGEVAEYAGRDEKDVLVAGGGRLGRPRCIGP